MYHFVPCYLPLATWPCHTAPLYRLSSGLQGCPNILRKAFQVDFIALQIEQIASQSIHQIDKQYSSNPRSSTYQPIYHF